MSTIQESVKTALRISNSSFDNEIDDLISAAKDDMKLAGITNIDEATPLIRRAIITYCRLNFGQPDDYDRLKESYDEQKKQLTMSSDFRDYGDLDG